MDKFLKRKSTIDQSSSSVQENKVNDKENDPLKESHIQLEAILKDLLFDPTLRPKINHYHPNYRDAIQRFYLQKSCCQPRNHAFPLTKFGKGYRQFNPAWFGVYGDWLEHSVTKDAAFYLYCYLFRLAIISQAGLSFRGHDETKDLKNQGKFLGLLYFLAKHSEHFKSVVLKNALGNLKFIAPVIQKDIVNIVPNETIKAIIIDLGDDIFSVLIDESPDGSIKEQMTIAIRYVDKKGHVLEQFLGIVHVSDITAISINMALESLFCKHGLSLSRLRGQRHYRASNM
ncbi:zinc finger MYM-type protein 1-like [Pistacia vera]|uniref:zinc finger MYM-type protein 1-like n=1 Tax=Pistacia vera TaxID=55513 RepID=UPI00126372A7|nr:zinc finger MYM-type protein 1-like [Pistacia vera]